MPCWFPQPLVVVGLVGPMFHFWCPVPGLIHKHIVNTYRGKKNKLSKTPTTFIMASSLVVPLVASTFGHLHPDHGCFLWDFPHVDHNWFLGLPLRLYLA